MSWHFLRPHSGRDTVRKWSLNRSTGRLPASIGTSFPPQFTARPLKSKSVKTAPCLSSISKRNSRKPMIQHGDLQRDVFHSLESRNEICLLEGAECESRLKDTMIPQLDPMSDAITRCRRRTCQRARRTREEISGRFDRKPRQQKSVVRISQIRQRLKLGYASTGPYFASSPFLLRNPKDGAGSLPLPPPPTP